MTTHSNFRDKSLNEKLDILNNYIFLFLEYNKRRFLIDKSILFDESYDKDYILMIQNNFPLAYNYKHAMITYFNIFSYLISTYPFSFDMVQENGHHHVKYEQVHFLIYNLQLYYLASMTGFSRMRPKKDEKYIYETYFTDNYIVKQIKFLTFISLKYGLSFYTLYPNFDFDNDCFVQNSGHYKLPHLYHFPNYQSFIARKNIIKIPDIFSKINNKKISKNIISFSYFYEHSNLYKLVSALNKYINNKNLTRLDINAIDKFLTDNYKNIRISMPSRSAGLWLWDRCNNPFYNHKSDKAAYLYSRKTKLDRKDVKEMFFSVFKENADDFYEETNFNKLFSTAEECIKCGKVYPNNSQVFDYILPPINS